MKKIILSCLFIVTGFLSVTQAQTSNSLVEKNLNGLVGQSKISKEDAVSWIVTSEHVSSTSKVHNIYFRQALNGLEILGTESSVHILSNGKELMAHNKFVKDAAEKATTAATPSKTAIQAVQLAASDLGYSIKEPLAEVSRKNTVSQESLISKGGISSSDISAKLMYQKLDNGSVVLVWDLYIQHDSKEAYGIRVNAMTGEIASKANRIYACDFGPSHSEEEHEDHVTNSWLNENRNVSSSALAGASYQVFAMPLQSALHGNRTIVSESDVANALASPFGWHDVNGVVGADDTVTIGNNMDAFKIVGANQDQAQYAVGGTSLVFHFPYGINATSSADRFVSASLTNLFYLGNITHDIFYQYGFDEASGNFQTNNYGKGGTANDPVIAVTQAQNGCSATFQPNVDGSSGIIRMELCNDRDGSFDNHVVAHEYTHGLTDRLTGGAAVGECLGNLEAMGEGWSDWYGLMMTMKTGDTRTDKRTIGTYLKGQSIDGPGFRIFPYTTDMAVNSHTYADVTFAGVPHGVGSVWCAMLWDMTWDLIDQYGFNPNVYSGNGGNNIALKIVTEALKLQPCRPGFVDARNAILAADVALFGGANKCIIWKAFARRGLGNSADQGGSFNLSDNVEAFDLPATCSSLGINEQKLNSKSIIVYPNPTDENVTIVNKSYAEITSVAVIDVNGRILKQYELNDGENEIFVSLKSFAPGVYFIKLISDREVITKAVVKK